MTVQRDGSSSAAETCSVTGCCRAVLMVAVPFRLMSPTLYVDNIVNQLINYAACFFSSFHTWMYYYHIVKKSSRLFYQLPLTCFYRAACIACIAVYPRESYLSVCLSVLLSNVWIMKTEESSAKIFIPYERTFILISWEECLVGRPLLPEILGQTDPVGVKCRFSVDIRS